MSKKKKVVGAAGIAAVALVGGTFAYFSQSTTIDNPFDTAKYGTIVTEDFNPEDGEDWQPGAEVNKDVYVENTGDRDVVVRVKFEDIWYRDKIEEPFKTIKDNYISKDTWSDGDEEGKRQPGDTLDENGDLKASNGVYGDGDEIDRTVVDKKLEGLGSDWIFAEEEDENGEKVGYFYYTKKLAPGATPVKFLDSVTLNKNTDMGKFGTTYYFAVAETGSKPAFKDEEGNIAAGWFPVKEPIENEGTKIAWTAETIDKLVASAKDVNSEVDTSSIESLKDADGKIQEGYSIYTAAVTEAADGYLGYSDAHYVLRITVETVQATDEAVTNVFGGSVPEAVINGWQLDAEKLAAQTPESGETSEETDIDTSTETEETDTP